MEEVGITAAAFSFFWNFPLTLFPWRYFSCKVLSDTL